MAQSKKGHNSWNIFNFFSKVNQVIFLSLPIYSLSYEALAPTVFEIYADKGKCLNLQRAITHAQKQ